MLMQSSKEIWRKYVTDGVPASGVNSPNKDDIRRWGVWAETMLGNGVGARIYATLAALNGDLTPSANTSATVYNDATAGNNGVYAKSGSSGSGSWTRIGDVPVSIVPLSVTGGTANAIVATAPETPTLPGRKLFLLTPTANNSGATTLAYNGGSTISIKSAVGSDLVSGNLIAGVQVVLAWQTDHFQLLLSTAVDAEGVLNDVLTARDAASGFATASAASATASASSAMALGNQVAQYDTRAAAIAATIPGGVNFVRTLAYDSTFISNSGAQFKRVAAGTPFTDTWPLTATITGGSGYTNGTYYGMFFSGSATGSGLIATVTISGGALTAVNFSTQPGNAYKVGDVLTFAGLGSGGSVGAGTGASITIATISSPLASFVNTVDNSRWQYLQSKGFVHVNEFGAKPDWAGTDASATNNFAAIQAALFFATRNFGMAIPLGLQSGDVVKCGAGGYMIQQPTSTTSLNVPNGVYLTGVLGSTIKVHDAWNSATNTINLGNPNAHFANFSVGMRDIQVFHSPSITATTGTYAVYSNNMQDGSALEHVFLQCGQRGGIKYEIGYGGASFVKFHDLNIAINSATPAFNCIVGTTIIDCQRWSLAGPSGGTNINNNAIVLQGTGGMYTFDGVHMEGFPNGFSIDLQSGNNPYASFKNITGGLSLAYVFTLVGTNEPGNCSFERCQTNNGLASGLVLNGQTGGSSRLTNIAPKDGLVFFNP